MEFKEQILKIRKDNNLTQEELASKLFVTRQAISKWELGKSYPSIDILKIISKQFNINLNDLLGINRIDQIKDYKAIGYKQYGFILIYSILLVLLISTIIIFNFIVIKSDTTLWAIIFYNFLIELVTINVFYMLIISVFPLSKILIEYNKYGLKIKTIKGTKSISFKEIKSIKIKTHGNYDSGKLIIKTHNKSYTIYPLKNLNKIKTIIDEIILIEN